MFLYRFSASRRASLLDTLLSSNMDPGENGRIVVQRWLNVRRLLLHNFLEFYWTQLAAYLDIL